MTIARKPLWRWDPFWYIVVFLLLVVANLFQAAQLTLAFGIALGVLIAVACVVVAALIVSLVRGPGNPDSSGNLSTLDGLELIDAAQTDAAQTDAAQTDAPKTAVAHTAVAHTAKRQSAIDAAGAFGGENIHAVLVPGATRWFGRRFRVSVQLVAGGRIFHAGFLPAELDAQWNQLLMPLRRRNAYLRVPASIQGHSRPYAVSLDLSGAFPAVDIANAQQASS
ncbi:MAG TPA: hypothetical protein VN045_12585 [Microbacteriaceae bacterium]|jgi:hypothetical protein|nr:hypothetical protein [Microbacteriaceae bacterium]